IPEQLSQSMGIALYALFIGLLVPSIKKNIRVIFVVIVAMLVNYLFSQVVSEGWAIVLGTLIGGLSGVLLLKEDKYMIFVIIIGMSLVTMIPRIIPAFIVERIVFKEWINKWLQAIPYAALGAMIFPGILYVKENDPMIGIVGGIVAIGLAFLGLNVMFVVLGAIGAVYLMTM